MTDNFKYKDITERVISASLRVHRNLGGGNLTENIFHRALLLKLSELGLIYQNEKDLPVLYKGKLIGKKRVDNKVEDKILVELRAVNQLEKIHYN